MSDTRDDIDWSKTTFEGSRIEQLRRWRALSIRQRFEALDELHYLSQRLAKFANRPAVAADDWHAQPQPQDSELAVPRGDDHLIDLARTDPR